MKKFTPHAWLAGNMVLFGFVTVMQGLVKSYSGLLATRFFLGVFGRVHSQNFKDQTLTALSQRLACSQAAST
jgi:hypothetical protein